MQVRRDLPPALRDHKIRNTAFGRKFTYMLRIRINASAIVELTLWASAERGQPFELQLRFWMIDSDIDEGRTGGKGCVGADPCRVHTDSEVIRGPCAICHHEMLGV
jgi:hypothetical protein